MSFLGEKKTKNMGCLDFKVPENPLTEYFVPIGESWAKAVIKASIKVWLHNSGARVNSTALHGIRNVLIWRQLPIRMGS